LSSTFLPQILGAGGMLASSEWIYWEALSLMIGTFGIIPLSVHTIPTQLITFQFMGPYSLGIALSIRLGATLPVNVNRSKQIVVDAFIISIVTFGTLSVIMFIYQDWFISIFTTTSDVIIGCHSIWDKVCIYAFCLSVYGIFMGVCVGLGMQWTLGIGTFITLWIIGLPSAYYFSVVKNGGIVMAWTTVWPPYVLLPIALGIAVINADWHTIANDIRIREGQELIEERRPSFIKINGVINANSNQTLSQQQALLLHSAYDESDKMYGSI
jgi:multidrug resistance protein, MATE family